MALYRYNIRKRKANDFYYYCHYHQVSCPFRIIFSLLLNKCSMKYMPAIQLTSISSWPYYDSLLLNGMHTPQQAIQKSAARRLTGFKLTLVSIYGEFTFLQLSWLSTTDRIANLIIAVAIIYTFSERLHLNYQCRGLASLPEFCLLHLSELFFLYLLKHKPIFKALTIL